jgi:hypothetical protein
MLASERTHEPVDLAELSSAAVAAGRTTDPAARVQLVTTGPVPAIGDREAQLRAIRNLLDNAIAVADTRHSRSHANTERSNRVGDRQRARGSTDQRERIFEPFVHLPRNPRGVLGSRSSAERPSRTAHNHLRPGPQRRHPIHDTTTSRLRNAGHHRKEGHTARSPRTSDRDREGTRPSPDPSQPASDAKLTDQPPRP